MVSVSRPVAFLGLGIMGEPMARRMVAADIDLRVWNRSAEKARSLSGARAAATPAEAVRGAEIICLCLTNAAAVEAVMFGPGGAAEAWDEGALVVDFSTIGVRETRGFETRARKAGRAWVDAPVSGGRVGAEAGTLTVFCGGAPDDIARAGDVLAAVAARWTRMGGPGAGQATKMCNQLIVSANLVAIAEAMALGRALGVEVKDLPDALRGGFADSTPLQVFGRRMADAPDAVVLARVSTMLKDADSIVGQAADLGLELPLIQTTAQIYRLAAAAGLADADLAAMGWARPREAGLS